MDRWLIHDAVIDAFEPVIEPAVRFGPVVHILSLPFDIAVIGWANQHALGNRQVGIDNKIIPGIDIKPAVDQVYGYRRIG